MWIQIFTSDGGGGGGGSPDGRKQPEQHCFCYQLNYRGGPLDLCQRKLYFSKDPEGAQHFPHFFFFGGGGSKC